MVLKAMFPVRYVWLGNRQMNRQRKEDEGCEKLRGEVKRIEKTKKGGGNKEMLVWRLVCYLATFFIYFSYPFMALWLKLSSFK